MNTESGFDLLRLVPHLSDDAFDWLGLDSKGHVISRGSAAISELPAARRVHLIVPAGQLAAHQITLPPGAGRHQQSLVEQALEDTLIGPRSHSHIVTAGAVCAGRRIWVINRAWLKTQLDLLSSAGLVIDAAYAEYDLLPAERYAITASGCVFHGKDDTLGVLDDAALLHELYGDAAPLQLDDVYAQGLHPKSFSLLTGEFQPRDNVQFALRQFKRSGVLVLALAGVLLLSAIVRWQQLETREKALKAEIRQTFATAFPGTPIVMDPYLQWESRRRESGSGEGYVRDDLDLIASLANTLGGDIHPRSIESRDGAIRVLLTESDAAKIRETMEKSGRPHEFVAAEAGFSRLEIRRSAQP